MGAPSACAKDFVSRGACLEDMEGAMELRHLRYFVAVAEEGSLTLAAEKRLHTAQPSLSRQIRDLEYEVGIQLMSRSVRGHPTRALGRSHPQVRVVRGLRKRYAGDGRDNGHKSAASYAPASK